ncbi:hypothetical protein [Dictyobacter kobayashii]|uniref:Uncharacterized protein n=1 Tax=Dictyobacter kobayashii TaxID=2014872 RepID=A0A402AH35_9CHLR|nr:hypothetical protein [Dictyobacter kobayashii]GCE18428.1 hypothetical protein KDK_22280 [Dictyobacter kobayashii]
MVSDFINQRRITPEQLITHNFALDNYQNALLTATRKSESRAIKVVFDYSLLPASVVPNVRASAPRIRRQSTINFMEEFDDPGEQPRRTSGNLDDQKDIPSARPHTKELAKTPRPTQSADEFDDDDTATALPAMGKRFTGNFRSYVPQSQMQENLESAEQQQVERMPVHADSHVPENKELEDQTQLFAQPPQVPHTENDLNLDSDATMLFSRDSIPLSDDNSELVSDDDNSELATKADLSEPSAAPTISTSEVEVDEPAEADPTEFEPENAIPETPVISEVTNSTPDAVDTHTSAEPIATDEAAVVTPLLEEQAQVDSTEEPATTEQDVSTSSSEPVTQFDTEDEPSAAAEDHYHSAADDEYPTSAEDEYPAEDLYHSSDYEYSVEDQYPADDQYSIPADYEYPVEDELDKPNSTSDIMQEEPASTTLPADTSFIDEPSPEELDPESTATISTANVLQQVERPQGSRAQQPKPRTRKKKTGGR